MQYMLVTFDTLFQTVVRGPRGLLCAAHLRRPAGAEGVLRAGAGGAAWRQHRPIHGMVFVSRFHECDIIYVSDLGCFNFL